MKWYHFSVEYFEDLRNVNHCEFLIMEKQKDSGKYLLQNTLRTWSQLKREKEAAAALKEKENPKSEKDKEKDRAAATPIPKRRVWGGCPNGCDHSRHSSKRDNSMHAMKAASKEATVATDNSTIAARRPVARKWVSSSDEEIDDPRGRVGPPAFAVDVKKSLDEVVSSPDGTPSYISIEDRMAKTSLKSPHPLIHSHSGRDFGGTASGLESAAGSDNDTEASIAEHLSRPVGSARVKKVGALKAKERKKDKEGRWIEESGMGRGAKADALGDQSDVGSDGDGEHGDIDAQKKTEESVAKSVY